MEASAGTQFPTSTLIPTNTNQLFQPPFPANLTLSPAPWTVSSGNSIGSVSTLETLNVSTQTLSDRLIFQASSFVQTQSHTFVANAIVQSIAQEQVSVGVQVVGNPVPYQFQFSGDPSWTSASVEGSGASGGILAPGNYTFRMTNSIFANAIPSLSSSFTASLVVGPFTAGPSCSDLVNGAVHPLKDGGTMRATFTPNFGKTLSQAATACGVDHFNWIQWVTEDNFAAGQGVKYHGSDFRPPYLDPPRGGWDYEWRSDVPFLGGGDDNKDGYLNEDWLPIYDQTSGAYLGNDFLRSELDRYTNLNTLSFGDAPTLPTGTHITFRTYLAGCNAFGTTCQLLGDGFQWRADGAGFATLVTKLKNLDGPGAATISGVDPVKLSDISSGEVALLASQGISVPEPCLGIVAMCGWVLQSCRRCRGRARLRSSFGFRH